MRLRHITALLLAMPLALAGANGDPVAGKKVFNRTCRVCHQVESGGGSMLGPNLADLVGRGAPVDPSYAYSDAFKSVAGKGLKWDKATLEKFLAAPTKLIPGSKMPMAVADARQRRDVVAYLSSLNP
jgi:cytochrome c